MLKKLKSILLFLFIAVSLVCLLALNNHAIFYKYTDNYEVYYFNGSIMDGCTFKKSSDLFVFNKRGESFTALKDFDVEGFLNDFNVQIKFSEQIEQGKIVYGYSNKIKYLEYIDGQRINVQIFIGKDYVKIGSPLIYGSF